MRIDFNEIASMTFPGMNNGTGMMSARMYNDDSYRIIPKKVSVFEFCCFKAIVRKTIIPCVQIQARLQII